MRHAAGAACIILLASILCASGSRTDWSIASDQDSAGSGSSVGPPPPHAPPAFQPLSAYAVPSVAIIGTAKAGTTDLYSLIIKTSRQAPGSRAKRMKEAKMLVEDGRQLTPGHRDLHEYLLRIGHACARAADPRAHASPAATNASYAACLAGLAQQHAGSSNASSSSSSNGGAGPLPLSVDATPMYLACPRAAAALAALSPHTKVVVLLRHPVDRAASLYNHRAHTEANRNLPVRVSNLTLDQWAGRFLDWVRDAPGVAPLLRRLAAARDLDEQARLYGQLSAPQQHNLLGLPAGPLTFAAYNRGGHVERNIFGTALYGPALAAWHAGYGFRPGQLLVVDAHAFFARRLEVLCAVHEWVHGRPLAQPERRLAARSGVQNARRRAGIRLPGAKLGGGALARVRAFYAPHTQALLQTVLPALRAEGAQVIGFDGPPWVVNGTGVVPH